MSGKGFGRPSRERDQGNRNVGRLHARTLYIISIACGLLSLGAAATRPLVTDNGPLDYALLCLGSIALLGFFAVMGAAINRSRR